MTQNTHTSRRTVLKGAGTIGIAGLAGCLGGGGSEGDSGSGSGSDSGGSNTLKIQHWWTGGDGSKAIAALLEGFKQKYPDITVEENLSPVALARTYRLSSKSAS